MKTIVRSGISFGYRYVAKPILFLQSPEKVHERMTSFAEILGRYDFSKNFIQSLFLDSPTPVKQAGSFTSFSPPLRGNDNILSQKVAGITFKTPIGLAAGFDYDAKLTQLLPVLGFGFGTVGTITNRPYGGNKRPLLGRLPKSQALMVNKGFKNKGANAIAQKLSQRNFAIPIGVSIGRTNILALKTQKESITDILRAFESFEKAGVANSYYELNISCPNLKGTITFYPPKNLRNLLQAVTKLSLTKPIFIKMPIEKTDKEVRAMMDVIVQFPIAGVIIGNLQKNRNDPALDPQEVARFPIGNFSGKPTWNRSNELIRLVYQHYGKKVTIIGCGGVFSAEDAYEKILLGASLIQLITGMIYQGPQLISQINSGLITLLQKDGYTSITQAVGKKV